MFPHLLVFFFLSGLGYLCLFRGMDKERHSKVCALALNTIFGYEPRFSHNIIDALGSAEAVFELPSEELLRIFGPFTKFLGQINGSALEEADRQYEKLTAEGIQIVGIYDDSYPGLLRDCPDAPVALYVRSATDARELFGTRPAVSVVGTRDLSLYGREWCRRIVEAISQAPSRPAIVSGLAIGVDINAHLAALDFGLPTIGVLPVGIDDVYPRRHRTIAERMAATPGCALITDYPPGTSPVAFNFLRRNRIIAGLSQATVLVESKAKGGGMMTARLAAGYGREVAALPGRIDDTRSQGCNLLLREKVAEPVVSLATLPQQLGLGAYNLRRKEGLESAVRGRLDGELPPQEVDIAVRLALAVKRTRGICFDELSAGMELEYSEICRYASLLESEGFIGIDLLQRCSINTNFK